MNAGCAGRPSVGLPRRSPKGEDGPSFPQPSPPAAGGEGVLRIAKQIPPVGESEVHGKRTPPNLDVSWDHEPEMHKSFKIKRPILRFMESFVFRSDLLTGHEPSRTKDEDEDEDEKRGQLPPVPHPASRTPHSEGSWEVATCSRTCAPALNGRGRGTRTRTRTRGYWSPVPHSASRTPHSRGGLRPNVQRRTFNVQRPTDAAVER